MNLFFIYILFIKYGLLSFGGGYVLVMLFIHDLVDKYQLLTSGEFANLLAIAQMTPGPIGINSATYVGYTAVLNSGSPEWLAVMGSVVASLAVMLPSVILMLVVSRFFVKHSKNRNVEAVFKALRPTVVGLIASAALLLMTKENFGSPAETPLQFGVSVTLFVAAFVAMKFFKVSPILILLLAGAFGGVFYGLV